MKPSTSTTTSLWRDRPDPVADEPLPQGVRLDDIIVGAGITGLTTALLLARAGRRVVVLEAGVVGSLASGNTTAKVSLLQGTKYTRMLRYQTKDVARAYVEGNLEGQRWMLRFCDDHGVPFQVRDSVTYASTPAQRSSIDDELRASRAVGLASYAVHELDVPFPQFGAVVLPEQAQLDPMDLLVALVEQIRAHGGTVHQGQRVVDVSNGDRRTVMLEDGTALEADHVVLATGMPILDRGLYFAKLEPMRSYVLAFDAPTATIPDGMYLSAGSPSRSVRDAPSATGRKLLIGGSGHQVGRTASERQHVEELRAWTDEHFPGAVETHAWSAQDYRSHDSVPYIGILPRGGGRIFVATGFDKWGMASGVMAGRSISSQILGEQPSWQKVMSHRVTRPSGAAHLASINAKVGLAMAVSAISAERRPAPQTPAEGQGAVGRRGVVPVGVSTVDGTTCAVRAICTHMGGVLSWNDNERTWDCPLHASRFAPDGTVIEGPAVRPLTRMETPAEQEQS
jgi:glycine/D-amino acid oxidase-like deaminating enzyme/nitrite reductase/ring-hydroxylating ferredoxin subunit